MTSSTEGPRQGARVGVIVPAAGGGRRMGGVPKAFLDVGGAPLARWSLETFLGDERVEVVVLVVAGSEEARVPESIRTLDPRLRIVRGGRTREASVRAGLAELGVDVDVVVVHDAARPLVDTAALERCLWWAGRGTSAVVGHPVVDTLKEVEDEQVRSTPDRSRFWQVQTPQVFPRRILERAHADALARGDEATDDAALVERSGAPVRVVPGARWNIKVTYPDDVRVAAHLLRDRTRPLRSWRPSGPEEWSRVAAHLKNDGLVAYPTGTVYGFGGAVTPAAVAQLARLKRRSEHKPFLILLADPASAPELDWTPEARALAEAFWPGPLTLILRDPQRAYPPGVHGPEGGVAVRVDDHPLVGELLAAFGEPLTSSSANAPGEPPAEDGEEVSRALEKLGAGSEVWVLDGGRVPGGAPSTLVDVTGPRPRLVRAGALSPEAIAAHVPLDV